MSVQNTTCCLKTNKLAAKLIDVAKSWHSVGSPLSAFSVYKTVYRPDKNTHSFHCWVNCTVTDIQYKIIAINLCLFLFRTATVCPSIYRLEEGNTVQSGQWPLRHTGWQLTVWKRKPETRKDIETPLIMSARPRLDASAFLQKWGKALSMKCTKDMLIDKILTTST